MTFAAIVWVQGAQMAGAGRAPIAGMDGGAGSSVRFFGGVLFGVDGAGSGCSGRLLVLGAQARQSARIGVGVIFAVVAQIEASPALALGYLAGMGHVRAGATGNLLAVRANARWSGWPLGCVMRCGAGELGAARNRIGQVRLFFASGWAFAVALGMGWLNLLARQTRV